MKLIARKTPPNYYLDVLNHRQLEREDLRHIIVCMLKPIVEQSQDASCSVFFFLSRCLNMCLKFIPGICSSQCIPSLKIVCSITAFSLSLSILGRGSRHSESWVHRGLSLTLFSGFSFLSLRYIHSYFCCPFQSLQLLTQAFMQRWWCKGFFPCGNSLFVESLTS